MVKITSIPKVFQNVRLSLIHRYHSSIRVFYLAKLISKSKHAWWVKCSPSLSGDKSMVANIQISWQPFPDLIPVSRVVRYERGERRITKTHLAITNRPCGKLDLSVLDNLVTFTNAGCKSYRRMAWRIRRYTEKRGAYRILATPLS